MKKVIVHWVEMRTLEVPDECPTDDQYAFDEWLNNDCTNNPYCGDPYEYDDKNYVVETNVRDFEIVDVEAIVPEEEKVGSKEDIHQR